MNIQTGPELVPVVEWNHQTYKILLTAAASGGRVGVFESVCEPNGGPPRHLHLKEDEIFYVISGEMLFWLEGATIKKGPGEIFHIPPGKEHTFTATARGPAHFVVHLTPGGFEGFFVQAAGRNLVIPEDHDEIAKLAVEYNMKITGPPLGV